MLTIEVDQYEFPHGPGSEESLRISVHGRSKRPYGDPLDFARVTNGVRAVEALSLPRSFLAIGNRHQVVDYLQRFAKISLAPDGIYPTYVFADDWNDLCLVIEAHDILISYHWYTTA